MCKLPYSNYTVTKRRLKSILLDHGYISSSAAFFQYRPTAVLTTLATLIAPLSIAHCQQDMCQAVF